MRITFVLPVLNMNGGCRVVAIYARELARRGHVVNVVAPPVEPIGLRGRVKGWLKGHSELSEVERRRSHFDDLDINCRVLERRRPVADGDVPDADVVVATWWETAEWVNSLNPHKGAKTYFIQHHEIFPYLPIERCRATYKLKFHKIVVANWLKNVMLTEYGDSEVDLVSNSVDKRQFFGSPRGKQPVPTAGFLYSVSDFKGVDISLAAIKLVRAQIPSLRVLCFGRAPPTRGLPLDLGTEYFVAPSQDKICEIYNACDVWLTSSRSEGFNLPAMEAMACRTPVVSTRTGWPEEAIRPSFNGLLFDVDDINGLAGGLQSILSSTKETWAALSLNAFETVRESSWEASSLKFEAALVRARDRAEHGETLGGSSCIVA